MACALAMQQAMAPLASMTLPSGQSMHRRAPNYWDALPPIQVKGEQAAVDVAVVVGPGAQRTRRSHRWDGRLLFDASLAIR